MVNERANVPSFHFHIMTEEDGEAICSWKYLAPYESYGWPSWEKMRGQGMEFGDPELRSQQYVSAVDDQENLVGYAQFFPLTGVIRLGLGLHPDCCGQGWGAAFTEAVVREAIRRYPGLQVDLEVAVWNERAIRSYQRAGFEIADQYELQTKQGIEAVYCMELDRD